LSDLTRFFNPKSVAIIGASRSPGKIGNVIVKNMISSGFSGKIFPINPKEAEIEGLPCYPSVEKAPEPPELAVVSVPAAGSLEVAEACGKIGVKNLAVISAGFKEMGKAGLELERRLVDTCRKYEMRMLGPNCVGLMDTHTPINASFAAGFPLKGEIAFISQSGAMVLSILDWSYQVGLGFSKFISLGNKADLTETHFIEDAADDPNTRVILCYIEDVENGPHFLEVARRASRKKPIIILKSGTSQAGAQAASSHTGALAGSDRVYDAVFRQKGVMRVESFHEMLAMINVLVGGKLPRGNKIAIITTSGGSGVFVTDKCEENGLELAQLSYDTRKKLERMLPPFASVNNPVDITSAVMVEPGLIVECSRAVSEDPGVDIIAVVYKANTEEGRTGFVKEMADFVRSTNKTVVNFVWGQQDSAQSVARALISQKAPAVCEIEYGVKAISSLVWYSAKQKSVHADDRPLTKITKTKEAVSDLLDKIPDGAKLTEYESKKILSAYGIPVTREELVNDVGDAVEAARRIGYPVVLKIESPDISHKTEAGGVKLNIKTPDELASAYLEIKANASRYNPMARIKGILVQEMLPQGVEVIVGLGWDSVFGPTVMFGLGGVFVEALRDIALRVPPLTKEDALEIIEEIKGRRLLEGFRHLPVVDKNSLAEIIMKIGQLALDFPRIAELDINPLVCTSQGIKAADALIVLHNQ